MAGIVEGGTGIEPMASVQVKLSLMMMENVTSASGCSRVHCTLKSVVHGPGLVVTDQPLGS